MMRSSDKASFSDFQSRLRDHLDHSKGTGRPLFIETNGETDAVVLSPAAFDELVTQADLVESLALLERSEQDIKFGRTQPAKSRLREIARELKLPLER